MNTYTKLLLRVIVFISLIYGLSTTVTAQTKKLLSVQDYTSIAKIISKAEGTDLTFTRPYSPGGSMTIFAGTFNGTLNSASKKFYCIDLSQPLAYSPDEYWDEGSTPPQITYILNNYYPLKTSYTGKLSDNNKEAAAVQIAIWHFSDNVDASTVTDATIRTRALAIIADATLNAGNTNPLATLQVIPTNQTVPAGTPASFYVQAISLSNTPVPGVTIQLTTTLGTLSTTSVITGTDGKTPTITLNYSSNGTASVKAKATVEIPQGTKYVHKTNPNDHQKLVLATPATDVKEVFTNIEFTCKNKIGSYVYRDINANGTKDTGEPGIAGAVVELVQGSTVIATATTDVNGFYSFPNLPNGTYTVRLHASNFAFGGIFFNTDIVKWYTKNSASVNTTLNCNDNLSINFGFYKICIGITKTADKTTYNPGDIVTYTITVENCGDLPLASGVDVYDNLLWGTTPYHINLINPGETFTIPVANTKYTVKTSDCGNLINTVRAEGHPVDLSANVIAETSVTVNIVCKSSIGDKVWIDTNGNGLQDSGEPGMGGVTVNLYDCSNVYQATTTTDGNGNYLFSNLSTGSYYVKFVLPAGFTFTTKDVGTNDAIDSDADVTTGKTICTTLSPNESDMTWDAGLKECKNKIGDFVWHDANANGIQDDGTSSGIGGVVVELLNSSGGLITSTTTLSNGYYEFANLSNGTYGIRIAASNFTTIGNQLYSNNANEKWFMTFKDKITDDTKDSDGDIATKTATVTLSCADNMTIDFGFFKVCVGLQKTGPTSVNVGDKITYSFTVTNCGDVLLAGGARVYDALLMPTGDHEIQYLTLTPGQSATFTYDYTTTPNNCGSLVNNAWVIGFPSLSGYTFNTTVRADDSHTVNVICNASIGDRVWIDTNGNGLQDNGEAGKSGVTVKLYDCSDNLKGTTTTNTSGNYLFNNLIPGSYYVKFDLPTGFTFTTKDVGTNDAIDSDADPTTGKTICTTLSAGENDMTWDASLKECRNTISGYVYRDKNANGTNDSEAGIAGAVVELVQGSTVLSNFTTGTNGQYTFSNLVSNAYTIRLASSNFTSGGVFFNTASEKWYTKGSSSVNTTLSCNDNLSVNFGYYKTCVSITKTADKQIVKPGDIITYTLTVQNCGDIPLASGVDIYDTMFPKVGIQNPHNVTLGAGNYYTEKYSYTVTANDCGSNNWSTIVNTARAVGHPADGSADVEFSTEVTVIVDCAQCLNKIGDLIWHDRNANGIQETGEPGISGVLVELLIGGSPYKTSTTDGTGKYKFENIPNGTYEVRIAPSNYAFGGVLYSTLQTKWYSSPKNQGSNDTKDSDANLGEPITVTVACDNDLAIDFGFYKTCVTITKTADKQTAKPGEFINYTITVDNCGDIALASGLDIYDEMFPKSVEGFPNPYHIALISNNFQVINYSYKVADDDCGGILKNTAKAVGHPINGSADVIDESTWSVAITCDMNSDLKIEKTVDNQNPKCDDYVTYTIRVTNNGPFKAKNVEVTDLLPTGLDYISSTSSQGTFNSSTGRWLVGDLNNGASATLAIRVRVNCVKINSATNILGQAKNYNLFVIEDLNQPSSDTQGKMAVGRDAYLANYSVGDALPSNSGDVLVVGRNLQFTSGRVYNGNAVYGNSTNLPIGPVTIDGSLRKDSPIDFVSAKAYLENLSTMLSGYTVNGTTTFQWSGLTLTGTDPYLNVFKVSGANLSAATSVTINAPNGSVVLVNIDGSYVTWTGGHVVNGTSIGNVLYNFYETTNLQIRAIDVRGSVLAPFAALYFPSGLISGQVICKSMVGAGQFNLSPFVGNIPCDKEITNTACITGVTTTDPNLYNNSASVKIIVSNNGSGSGTGSGNTGGWQFTGGFAVGEIIYTMTCINNDIYAGTSSGKIYKSTNRGQTWTRINNSMNVSFIWSLINYNGTLYAATDQGIFFYYNGTWILAGLSSIDVHSLVAKNGIIYAGTWGSGVFKSTGSSWSPINTGLSSSLTIQSLTIGNSGDVFAGTVGGGLFKLTNGVGSWNAVSGGNNLVWSTGSTASAVFAGTYGEGLYRSIDGGYSFSKLTSLDVPYIYSIVNDGTGKVYVSSLTSGVFVSSDNGSSWTTLGMGGVGVSSITVSASTGQVYAGTRGGQVYSISSNNNATDVNDNLITPTEYKLAQNYPNPFNPSTTIEFVVPNAGMYSLKVYNTLGQEVANLVENELASGLHKVNFDASKLASGMYIYKLSGNNVNVSKKMILMK